MSRKDLDRPTAANDLANYMSNNFSNDVLEPLVQEHLKKQLQMAEEKKFKKVIIEGYPRTANEAQYIMQLARNHTVKVIHLKINLENALVRASKRKRDDDGKDALQYRFSFWKNNEDSILKSFKEKSAVLREIDVNDSSKETICHQVLQILNSCAPVLKATPDSHEKENAVQEKAPSSFWGARQCFGKRDDCSDAVTPRRLL